ncbi:hypothetical protein F5148DRAFT_1279789 [Russula earlei]|uniref:Uncharacterized protein n=1 Tax=Russula earlei TaxID=71964 RepID=A0ACC0ULI0_9AGAM|nr:hypothetical protein F5148DRAFT_1279789 [Russula earlei]
MQPLPLGAAAAISPSASGPPVSVAAAVDVDVDAAGSDSADASAVSELESLPCLTPRRNCPGPGGDELWRRISSLANDVETDDALQDASSEANNSRERHMRQKSETKTATTIRVLDAGQSTNSIHYKPAGRTLYRKNSKSEVVGRGAGRLATPNVQGLCQFLRGPNVQQELMSTTGGMVQQQEASSANDGELEAAESYPFRISKSAQREA